VVRIGNLRKNINIMKLTDLTRDEINNLFPKIEISGTEEIKLSGFWLDGEYLYELIVE